MNKLNNREIGYCNFLNNNINVKNVKMDIKQELIKFNPILTLESVKFIKGKCKIYYCVKFKYKSDIYQFDIFIIMLNNECNLMQIEKGQSLYSIYKLCLKKKISLKMEIEKVS